MVESDDDVDENKSYRTAPSVVGRKESPLDATSNNRRGSMLRNKKMRRQTSVGSLLVHEQGNDKFEKVWENISDNLYRFSIYIIIIINNTTIIIIIYYKKKNHHTTTTRAQILL
jgi:hypothetical protein